MSFADQLTIIRRFLRDPNGNIWSDAYLKRQYNDVQKDLQNRTSILESYVVQRVPGVYTVAYMHDWEFGYLPLCAQASYQCLRQHDSAVFCHSWEPQVVAGIEADATDAGAHVTQPWEGFVGETIGEPPRFKFPTTQRNLKFIAYDEFPLFATTKKIIQSRDSSYLVTQGRPVAYYEFDDIDETYVLYPRPPAVWNEELDNAEGMIVADDGDTEDVTDGQIGYRGGTDEPSELGVAFDLVNTTDNVFLVFDVDPVDIVGETESGDFPDWMQKYLRAGVLERAYGANTDGRIPSLAAYWGRRYGLGVRALKRYRRNRVKDMNNRLVTQRPGNRRKYKHARLPDSYPDVQP